ncbi:MAG: hypothetical protein AB7L91_08635 [Dehalococcoidia bacterium]
MRIRHDVVEHQQFWQASTARIGDRPATMLWGNGRAKRTHWLPG